MTRKQAIITLLAVPSSRMVKAQEPSSNCKITSDTTLTCDNHVPTAPVLIVNLHDGSPSAEGIGSIIVNFGKETRTITAQEIWDAFDPNQNRLVWTKP